MYTMTRSKRFAGSLRNAAFAVTVAGLAAGTLAVPALAQDSVTTTRTTTYYDGGPTTTRTTTYYDERPSETTTYYAAPTYYDDTYTYPPAPAYTYVAPAPPPAPIAGVSVGVPGFGVQLGF